MSAPVVLFADDSQVVRALLRKELSGLNFELVEAEDGDRALALMRQHPPDVVILDIEMPGRNGYEVLTAMKGDEFLRSIPVLFLTSRSAVTDLAEGLMLGAHDYLSKPFAPDELVARVTAAYRTKQLQDELRHRNDDLEGFTSHACHELKAPLSSIKGMAEALLNDSLSPEEKADLLTHIGAAADRASAMVQDLLLLARQGTAAIADSAVDTDIRHVIDTVLKSVDLPDADVKVEGEWANAWMAEADAYSVFTNLVANAGHYGRAENGRLALTITGMVDDKSLEVQVWDTGEGVSSHDALRIFDPFVRLNRAIDANPASTGIGLAIVRRSVERWGGGISLCPADPQGVKFVVRLPRASAGPVTA